MSRSALAGVAAIAAVACVAVLTAQQNPPQSAVPHPPYTIAAGHFKMPAGRKVGSTAGITIDRDGSSVWVFERCGGNDCVGSMAAPILKFDATGKVIANFGGGMF